ncbi:MAG: hypothetical protein AAF739_05220 [Pseudomonadota bacterium]
MADFNAILRKALASRPDATGEERRKIYERARQALIRQLSGFEPPLPPEDISRQRLALESAIRKVEADVASQGSFAASGRSAASSQAQDAASVATGTGVDQATPSSSANAPAPAAEQLAAAVQNMQPATATAAVSALKPKPAKEPPLAASDPTPALVGDPDPQSLPDFEPERSQAALERTTKRRSSGGWIGALVALLVIGGGAYAVWFYGLRDQGPVAEAPAVEEELPPAPEARQVGAADPTRSSERLLPDNQGTVEEPLPTAEPEPTAQDDDAAAGDEVAEEEAPVEAEPEVAAVPQAPENGTLPVAQNAVLYEEGLTPEAAGFTAPGRAIWRLETVDGVPVIVGTIEVPGRGISLDLRISRNLDETLPASHLLEFSFNTSESFPTDGIAELVGVVVKPEEQAGGDPLRGAIVDLGSGVFWQALAASETDLSVNLPLLQEGQWFDLPILYSDNRRAIISFEKGADGEQVFQQALTAWSQ